MAWEARWGLKLWHDAEDAWRQVLWLNGLGSPLGIETLTHIDAINRGFLRLNGLGSPLGIETIARRLAQGCGEWRLNGLGSPLGIETKMDELTPAEVKAAKWPGKPVGD